MNQIKVESISYLVLGELLSVGGLLGGDLKDVVANGLGEGAALSHDDLVSDLGEEGGAAVGGDVAVTLLVTLVLVHEVEVVTADDDGALHLGGVDDTAENATTDGHATGEGALLVDVLAHDGILGGLEAKTDGLPVAGVAGLAGSGGEASVLVGGALALVSLLDLDGGVEADRLVVLNLGRGHCQP